MRKWVVGGAIAWAASGAGASAQTVVDLKIVTQ